jgi:hypothetical protein
VNALNDIQNCGACGNPCTGTQPYCHNGTCGTPECATTCSNGPCCGMECCSTGQLCCDVYGGVQAQYPFCTTPTATGTCPAGCPACVCASPDTPIATPQGDRPIADLAPGDLVYSVQGGAIVAVPVLRTNRAPVHDHHVVRVRLANGAVLEVSPRHPTADGRTFGELRAGEQLDRIAIVSVDLIPYAHPFTYDILPASETHTYYAGGALIGTTLTP